MEPFQGETNFGIQQFTCIASAQDTYCSSCKADENHSSGVHLCITCERFYCSKSLWWSARIVMKCIVWVARRLRNVIVLSVGESFVLLPAIRSTDVINVTEAGAFFVTIA